MRQDDTKSDATKQGKTGHDRTGRDRAGQDRTEQHKMRRNETRQGRTGQDKTGQDKTRPDKTRQDKTRQGKTFKTSGALPCPVCPLCLLGFIMSYVVCPHLFLESRHGDLRHFPVGFEIPGVPESALALGGCVRGVALTRGESSGKCLSTERFT